jgi:hypothetical protein
MGAGGAKIFHWKALKFAQPAGRLGHRTTDTKISAQTVDAVRLARVGLMRPGRAAIARSLSLEVLI